jgi:WD40 repeat protein
MARSVITSQAIVVAVTILGAATLQDRHPLISAITVTPDGTGVLVGSQAGVYLATPHTEPRPAFETALDHVHDLVFSPDGKVLAVAGGSPAESGALELWSWPDRVPIYTLEGHDDIVHAVQWLPDSKTVISAGADRTIRIWNAQSGKSLANLKGHSGPVMCLAVSPDGKLLCSGSLDQTIRVWDTAQWKPLRALTNHLGPVQTVQFVTVSAPSTSRITYLSSAGDDRTVRLWQPENGRMVRILHQPAPVLCSAFDSANLLYTGAADGYVRTINLETGQDVEATKFTSGWVTAITMDRKGQIWAGDSFGRVALSREAAPVHSQGCNPWDKRTMNEFPKP